MVKRIELQVNGRSVGTESCTLAQYIIARGLDVEALVVEYNGTIIRQDQWPEQLLADGDRLELLGFVGGG